jgi:hypothetical protein
MELRIVFARTVDRRSVERVVGALGDEIGVAGSGKGWVAGREGRWRHSVLGEGGWVRRFWDVDRGVGGDGDGDGEAVVGVDGGLKEVGVDGELESLEIEVAWDGSDVDADEVHIFFFIYPLTGADFTSYFSIAVPIPGDSIYLAPFSDVTDSAGNRFNFCPAPSHSHPAASQASSSSSTTITISSPHRSCIHLRKTPVPKVAPKTPSNPPDSKKQAQIQKQALASGPTDDPSPTAALCAFPNENENEDQFHKRKLRAHSTSLQTDHVLPLITYEFYFDIAWVWVWRGGC